MLIVWGSTVHFHQSSCDTPKLQMVHSMNYCTEFILETFSYLLTYSIQRSPSWKAGQFAANQETPHILWNQKVHNRIHKFPPPVPILFQLDPVHHPTFYFEDPS